MPQAAATRIGLGFRFGRAGLRLVLPLVLASLAGMGAQLPDAVAQPFGNPAQRSGPHAPPIEVLRGPRANRPARTMPDADATQPRTWSGFDNLTPEVQSNLLESGGTILSSPSYTPNVRANDPTGDLTNEGQYSVSIAAWNRFVVVSWIDTKGLDAPGTAPPSTYAGYAYSCDWGATFVDGGSVPRPVADEQVYRPAVARSESGEFYMVAPFATGLSGTATFGIGFWKGTFDTTACTFAWGARQTVPGMAVVGDDYDVPSIAVDPANGRIWVAACHIPGAYPNWYIIATASDDGGTTWKPVQTLSQTTGFPASYYPNMTDIAVGPDGEAHVVWGDTGYWFWCDYSNSGVSHIVHSRSTDGGTSWSAPTMAAPYFSPYLSDGPLNPFGYHRPIPRVAVDRTNGGNRGRVYAAWAAGTYWGPPAPGTGTTVPEVEPNDVPANALTLVPGDDATGIGESNTMFDWWRIDLVAGQALLVRLEPDGFVCNSTNSSYYFRIGLRTDPLDPLTAPIDTFLTGSATSTAIHQLVFSCKQTGTYYLRAVLSLNTSATNVPYTLRTRLITWGAGPGSGRDESDILFASSPDGVTPWTAPARLSDEAPIGYCETDPDVAVDASGRVHVIWHDFRETEVEPRLTLQGEIADLFMRTSTNGGASFAPAERVSAVSGLFGLPARTNFIYNMFGNDLVADGDHLMLGWSDMRHPDRLTTHSNAYTQFVDKELPSVAITSAPAGTPGWTNVPPTIEWQGTDRRYGPGNVEYRWDLFDMPGHTLNTSTGFPNGGASHLVTTPGYYAFELYARDPAGNATTTPVTTSFILDQQAPVVTMLSGPASGVHVNSGDVTFSWSATDNWSASFPDNFGFSYTIDGASTPYPPSGSGVGPTSANLTGLAPGPHEFSVRARDLAGNESTPVAVSFVVDTQAPETTILTGPAEGATITINNPTFTFTGSDDQTATAQLQFDFGSGYGAVTSATPSYADGAQTFSVRAKDLAGNEDATPAARGFTVHTIAPTVTLLTGPANGGFSGASATFTWNSTLSPAATTVTYATNQDGAGYGAEGAGTSLALTGLTAGSHTLIVRATDNAGLQGTATVTWTVDLTAPTVAILTPVEGAHIGSTDVAATWSGDDGAGSGGVQYSWRVDGGAWSAYDAATGATIPGLAEGARTLELRAVDAVGNLSGGTTTCNFDATGLVSWWRAEGDPNDGWGANHGTVVNGSVGYQAAPFPRGQVFLFDNSGRIQVPGSLDLLPGTGSFTIEAWFQKESNDFSGTLQTIAGRHDNQSGAGLFRSRYVLQLDASGYLVFQVKASSLTPGTGQVLGSGFDPADGMWHHVVGVRDMSAAVLRLYVDGTLAVAAPLTTQSNGLLQDQSTIDPFVIGAGLGEFGVPAQVDDVAYTNRALSDAEIAAIYAAGGRSCTGGGVGATRNFAVDLTAPETQILSGPAEGGTSYAPSAAFDFTGTDNLAAVLELEYAHAVDGGAFGPFSPNTQAFLSGLSAGPHTLAVVARDRAGNVDATAATRSWTVEIIPPVVTFLTGPAEGATSGPAPTFTWSSTISPGAVSVTYETSLDGATFLARGTSTSLALTALADGAHTLVVRATDNFGLQGTATRSWIVDGTPPVLTLAGTPEEGAFTNSGDASFSWSATDASGSVEYAWQIDNGGFGSYDASTSTSFTGLAPGSHTFEVRAIDAAGNVSQTACAFGTGNIVSWWEADLDESDSWGANTAAFAGGAAYTTGVRGSAWDFTGSPRHVVVPHHADLDPGAGSFTIELWLKTTAVSAELVNKSERAGSIVPAAISQYRLSLNNGRPAFGMRDDAVGATIPTFIPAITINDGAWHHIAAGRDMNTRSAFIFVDGVQVTRGNLPADSDGPIGDTDGEPDPMYVGARYFSGVIGHLVGQVDEVLFHRRALPPAEIAAIHAAGGRGPCAPGRSQARTWRVDTTPPVAQFVSGPPTFTNTSLAAFVFGATEADSPLEMVTHRYALNGQPFTPWRISSGLTTNVFSTIGPNTLMLQARDAAGNVSAPITHNWTYDNQAPETQIVSGPPSLSTSTTANFEFGGSDNASATADLQYSYALDGAASPFSTSTMASLVVPGPDAAHILTVVARDQAGNVDGSPASHTWTIHATAPVVTLDSAPAEGEIIAPEVTLVWSAVLSPVATGFIYEVEVDGVTEYSGYATTTDLVLVPPGAHTVVVRATDNAGLQGTATRTWTVDGTPPVVTLLSGPPQNGHVASAEATFEWSTADAGVGGVRSAWRLDNGPWTYQGSPFPISGAVLLREPFDYGDGDLVPNGGWTNHSGSGTDIQVLGGRAIGDMLGFPDDHRAFPAQAADATTFYALDVVIPAVAGSPKTNYFAHLKDEGVLNFPARLFVAPGSVNGRFHFGISVNNSTPAAIWPADLDYGRTYRVVASYDAAAGEARLWVNPADQASPSVAASGGTAGIQVSAIALRQSNVGTDDPWTWSVDNLGVGATFDAAVKPTPLFLATTVSGLVPGAHTFLVVGSDQASNSAPLGRTWTVDLAAPETQITAGPAEGSTQTVSSATLDFSGSDDFSAAPALEYSFTWDAGAPSAFLPLTSATINGLAEGVHSFAVVARDQAGNVDATPATRTWTVHTQEPVVTLDVAPAEGAYTGAAVPLAWSSVLSPAATGVTYETKLDEAPFVSRGTATTLELTGLAGGTHTLILRATDNAGLMGEATRSWQVDGTPPVVTIVAAPPEGGYVASGDATIEFSVADAGIGGETATVQVDAETPTDYPAGTHVLNLTGLGPGPHSVSITAVDAAGNAAAAQVRSWTVDLAAPETQVVSGPPALTTSTMASFEFSGSDDFTATGALEYAYTLDSDPESVFSAATTADLMVGGDAVHTLSVRARDQAGNLDPSPATHTWTVQTTPPVVTFSVGPPEGSYTGAAVLFNWSSVPSPVATGVTYEVNINGGGFVSFGPTTTLELNNPPEGPNSVVVRATDNAGLQGTATRSWIVDRTPPTVSMAAPFPDGAWTSSTALSFVASATDNLPEIPGFEHRFAWTFDADPQTAFAANPNFGLPAVPEGPHTLSVLARDGAGNVSLAPATRSWTVDVTPPVPTVEFPTEGEEVTSADIISLLSATDNLAPTPSLEFTFRLDNLPYSGFTTNTTAPLDDLVDGPHMLVVQARDLAGNVSAEVTRNFTVLATPPVITFLTGPTLAVPNGSADVTFTWSATSTSTPAEQLEFAYAWDAEAFVDVGNSTTATIQGLGEGVHVLRVRARDRLNHEAILSRDFAVDLTAPTVAIVSGIAEGGWTNATSTTFGFGGSDNYSPPASLMFSWKLGLDPETSFDPATSALLDPLNEGVHTFSVRGRDPAGNISPMPATRTFTVDRTPPETDIVIGPTDGTTVTTASLVFTVSGADDRAAPELLSFSYAVDGGSFSTPAPGTSVSPPVFGDGPHTFAVRAVDAAGNIDATPATRSFMVDANGPALNFLAGPPFGACVATNEVTFGWAATDAVSAVGDLVFAFRLDGSPLGSFSPATEVTLTSLSEGLHDLQVHAKDLAGNVTVGSRSFTVDITAPVAQAPTARTEDDNNVRFTFTGTDNNGITGYHIQVDIDPQFPAPLAETDIGATGSFVLAGSVGNTYYARARARDCAGNLSPYSAVSNGATINPLPDLTVAAVQAPATANSGQSIQVSWTVHNNGPGGTQVPVWVDDLYLSPTPVFSPGTATFLGRFDNLSFLAVGEEYVNTRTVILPRGASGPNYLVVVTDNLNQMPEADGGNNAGQSAAVQITLSAHADLQVTQVVAPPTAFSGETVEVRWTVTNAGTGRTDVNDWFDTVFLSGDAVLDFTVTPGAIRVHDTPLGTLQRVGAIDPGESYTTSRFVTLPEGINGNYHVFVAADLEAVTAGQPVAQGGRVFEHVAELNFSAPSQVAVLLQPPANLVVDAVTPTGSFNAGDAITVSFDVRNGGFNPSTTPAWSDRVYLSTNATFESGSDVLLGAATHTGGLDLDATYSAQVTGTLPNGISGPHWVIVVTDAAGQAYESNEGDNTRASATSFPVALPSYADLVVTSGSVQSSAQANDRIQVTWETTNAGSAATRASSWRDEVWISPSVVWSPVGARKLASVENGSALAVDAGYTRNATVHLPLDRTGAQYIHIVADAENAEYEHTAEGNNTVPVGAITVAPYPAIDLVVSGVTASHAPSSGTSFDVTWNVQNSGSGTTLASTWGEQVYLSADASYGGDVLLASLSHVGALSGGAGYSRTATVQVPNGTSGSFYLIVRSDPGGVSGDGDLADNTAVSAAVVPITLTPAPDLVVQGVTAQPGVAGQPLAVEWTILNQGSGAAVPDAWRTRAYLSLDQYLDAEDLKLDEVAHTGGLAAGANYVDVRSPELPVWASGPYYLIVLVDTRGEVYEAAEGNNQALTPVVVSLAEPADLEVVDVQAPAAAVPGDPVTVTWTVRNIGQTTASGVIKNAVFFSTDGTFEPTDPLLDLETQTINLDPGALMHFSQRMSLARTLQMDAAGNVTGELAGVSPGSYYAIVRANVIRNIREENYANNDVVGVTPMDVTVTPLTLGVPEATTATAGRSRYFVVSVPAGQDLRVRATSDQTAATNELFVAYGRTATPGDFDFSGPPTFTSRPVITVPTTEAGDYFVLVRALAGPMQNLTVQADALPYSLTAMSPSQGGQPGIVTTTISGAGLRPDTRVFLYHNSEPGPEAEEVEFVNSTMLRARWNTAKVPPGIALDVVALTGGETATLMNAFTAVHALPPQLTTTSLTPDVIRENATTSFTFRYRNDGNTDVGVLRVRLLFPAGSELVSLVKGARLLSRSDLLPELHTAGEGDAFVVGDGGAVPLKVVDLQAADLAPAEELSVTLNLRGFTTSPYTVRSLTEIMSPSTFLRRELARIEKARQAILANPDVIDPGAVAQASSGTDFASAAVENGLRLKGLLSQREIDEYVTGNGGLAAGSSDAPEGPAELLAEVLAGGPCAPPMEARDCQADSGPVLPGQPACATCVEDDLPIGVRLPMPIDLPLPGSACAGFTNKTDATGKVVAPCDPNVITGPAGYGPERWVAGVQTLTYRVDFENLAEVATAPAQVVRVTVPLDVDFDMTTFRLGTLGFGVHTITVPPNRTTYSAEPYYDDLGLNVRITAGIDVINRKAVWTLTSIDPLTGLQPANPYLGFLPVNDPQGRGQGFVTFTIRALGTVPTGTALHAQGEIVFDTNQPLFTEVLQNQVDNEKPVSQVLPNPVVLGDNQVEIAWLGADAPGGAGIESYALYMRADDGPFALQTQNLTAGGMTLQLATGHTYGFYTLAKDNSGNQEVPKLNAEATADLPGTPTEAGSADLPLAFAVYQSFPNPLRDRAAVRFDLPRAAEVTLEVFDVAGRRVLELAREQSYPAGRHRLVVRGADLSPGLFFYRFRAGDYEATRKLLVLR